MRQAPLYDHPAISRSYFFPHKSQPLPNDGHGRAVTLQTDAKLHAYWYRPLAGAPTLLYLHGNGETVGDQRHWLDWSRKIGVNLMLVDYPGYGGSSGSPSIGGCRRAARAALDYLLARPDKEVPSIIAMGRSVGSIFALDAAAACRSPRLRGLVLESGVADVMQRLEIRVPFEKVGIDRGALGRELKRDFDHESKLQTLARPLLVMHTRHDNLVPSWHGEKLAKWARPTLHKLVLFDRGDHNSIQAVNQDRYLAEMKEFVTKVTPPAPPHP